MNIEYGKGKTRYGPGVNIYLTGEDVVGAILAFLVAHSININGPCTAVVNGELCESGCIYVDPSGFVIDKGKLISGRGEQSEDEQANDEWDFGF